MLQTFIEDGENHPPPGDASQAAQVGLSLPVLRALQPCCESRGIKVGLGYASDDDDLHVEGLISPETIMAQVCAMCTNLDIIAQSLPI